MAVGIGLCVNNARAVFEAMADRRSGFERTPKYGVERTDAEWLDKRYRQSSLVQPFVELGLGVYFTAAVAYALAHGIWDTLPFLVLFQAGYFYTGGVSLLQQIVGQSVTLEGQVARE